MTLSESQTWDRQTDAQWDAYLRTAHGPPAYTLTIRVLGDTFTPLAVWNRGRQIKHFEETIIIFVSTVVHFILKKYFLLPWMDGVRRRGEWSIDLDFGIWPMLSMFVVVVDEDWYHRYKGLGELPLVAFLRKWLARQLVFISFTFEISKPPRLFDNTFTGTGRRRQWC